MSMTSCFCRGGWRCVVFLVVVLLGRYDTTARSQSPDATPAPFDSQESAPEGGATKPPKFSPTETPGYPAQIVPTTPPSSPAPPQPDLEALRKMIREELQAEKAKAEAEACFAVSTNFKLCTFLNDGFVAESADKAFRFHFGGRLEWDNAWFTQDPNLLIGPNSLVRYQDGTDFRRARLVADGRAWEFIDFITEVNFANIQDVPNVNSQAVLVGSVGLTQFNLTFRDVPLIGNVRVGLFQAPYSLENYTSSNAWYFMERSPVYDAFFGPNSYQSGVMLFNSYQDDRVTLSSAFTRVGMATLNNFGFEAADGLYAAGVRLTGLPVYQDEGRVLVHLGVNYFHQALGGHTFAVANRMPLRAGGGPVQVPNLLATGNFFTPNGADFVDFEVASVYGPFALSAEYALARGTNIFDSFNGLTFSGPRGDVTYHAFYVEGGCFITPGDYRRYNKKIGTWDRTIPEENAFVARGEGSKWCRGHGAVQLLARYTYLDLVSGSPPLTSSTGGAQAGTQQDVTLGVNWYLNPQTIISLNYVWSHVDSVVPGASGNVQGVGTRLHFDF